VVYNGSRLYFGSSERGCWVVVRMNFVSKGKKMLRGFQKEMRLVEEDEGSGCMRRRRTRPDQKQNQKKQNHTNATTQKQKTHKTPRGYNGSGREGLFELDPREN